MINLSALLEKPTGLSVYTQNVVPRLNDLAPIVLLRESLMESWAAKHPGLRLEPIRNDLSADSGSRGHARRLAWVETVLVNRLRRLSHPMLFSPVPEAPVLRRVPSVVTVFDFIPQFFYPTHHPLHRYTRHYVPRVLRSADHVLAISQATADDAMRLTDVDRHKVTVTPLACDTEHFLPLGLERKPFVLYLGRYAPYKNIDTALRAFADAAVPGFEFWMAGPPDPGFDELLREFRDRQGIAVRFLPYPAYEDLPTLLNEARALVFPSRYEGFGLPILEAMACGTPVITSDVSAMPEVAGTAGVLVNPDDGEAMANAIRRLLQDPLAAAELSRAGLLRSREFSWDRTGESTRRVLAKFVS